MPNWVAVVILIAAVLAVGMLRERWRIAGLERLCRSRGGVLLSPFTPGDQPPVARMTTRFEVRGARLWGVVVEFKDVAGTSLTVAEHQPTPIGSRPSAWYSLVVWPTPGAGSGSSSGGPLVLWPGAGKPGVLGLLGHSFRVITDRLGLPEADPASLQLTTDGGLMVEGAPATRAAFLNERRVKSLESWPHGGEFVIDGEWCGWRVKGLLTPGRLEEILGWLPAARALME